MSEKKLQSEQKSFKKGTIEINMSTLSNAQKQMCLKLLASSNINFEQDKNENIFEAELRINPANMNQQITSQKKNKQIQQPKVSPIKKRQTASKLSHHHQAKQNIGTSGNKKPTKQLPKPPTLKPKTVNHAIYTNSRKPLGKTIKINNLTEIQKLHPYIQLYIYPKKMSFQSLVEVIQEIYELYWNVEIQGKMNSKTKRESMNKNQNNDNKMRGQSMANDKYNKSKGKQSTKDNNNNNTANDDDPKHPTLQPSTIYSFPHWVYHNFILQSRQKQLKPQQLLVNLIESLNHFSFKHIGVQIFINFLSGYYSLDTLNYFLVIRALLEQLTGEKIIERISSYGVKAGMGYKIKLNPYSKQIEQGRVYDFLQVCFQGSKQQSLVDQIFQQMTRHMFFDQKKRKNFIHYFDMVNILLKQFMKSQPTNNNTITNLELSITQTHQQSEFNQFITYSNWNNHQQEIEQEKQLTFEVQQVEQHVKEKGDDFNNKLELENYLPNSSDNVYQQQEQSQLQSLNNNYKQQQKSSSQLKQKQFHDIMINHIYSKYHAISTSFSISNQFLSSNHKLSKTILDTLLLAVMKSDKTAWVDMLKNKIISIQRETQQLHFIEQLQKEYQQIKNANFISTQFIKKLLTASYLREAIVMEAGISSKTL